MPSIPPTTKVMGFLEVFLMSNLTIAEEKAIKKETDDLIDSGDEAAIYDTIIGLKRDLIELKKNQDVQEFRLPTDEEIKQYQEFCMEHYGESEEEAKERSDMDIITIIVIPKYMSDCPGYWGKVFYILGGQPEFHSTLIEDKYFDEDEGLVSTGKLIPCLQEDTWRDSDKEIYKEMMEEEERI